jgi:hypothetical protein
MADQVNPKATRIDQLSPLDGAKVSVTSDHRLHVEFKINELIKKLVPGGALSSSCGGCGGCSGCGH